MSIHPTRRRPHPGRWRTRSRTLVRCGTALAALAALAAGPALGQLAAGGYDRGADAEDVYLELLRQWALGSPSAVEELSDLLQQVVSAGAGFQVGRDTLGAYYGGKYHRMTLDNSSAAKAGRRLPNRGCLGKIQNQVDLRLAAIDPEALLPLAYFHHLLHLRQLTGEPFRPWLAELSRERALWLGEHYGEKAKPRPAARRLGASMLAAVADVAATVGLQEAEERARDVYSWVLTYAPDHPAGLYWSAYLAERAGEYGVAVSHLKDYLELFGDDPEVALRLGVNRARTGRDQEAARLLDGIARGAGPEPWRIVAYQELGRLHAEGGEGRAAVAYLREATAAFPDNSRLRLQLSYLLRDDWAESSALLRRVEEGWSGDAGRSPRALYDLPRRREIDDELARLEIEVERRKESLARALGALLDVAAVKRLRIRECAGALGP